MYQVTLQTSKRKTEDRGFFSSREVAEHVASTLVGFDAGEGPTTGTVIDVQVDTSPSVEAYEASQESVLELQKQEEWATFYESLSPAKRALISNFVPASMTQGA
jgi:hypothetical protein